RCSPRRRTWSSSGRRRSATRSCGSRRRVWTGEGAMDEAESGRPPFDEARAQQSVGKYILIGLTYRDDGGNVGEQQQLHGRIVSAAARRGFGAQLAGRRSGETYCLPPDMRSFQTAPPGEYRLRSTGEVIEDPDLLATWIVDRPAPNRDERST